MKMKAFLLLISASLTFLVAASVLLSLFKRLQCVSMGIFESKPLFSSPQKLPRCFSDSANIFEDFTVILSTILLQKVEKSSKIPFNSQDSFKSSSNVHSEILQTFII